ncbi:MAG: phospholipid carrier-dependent glycosyltransferase [Chitinivibrionales bacterium]|nr:phospholipid carrier-dependent glycosyltransferase [Chitinivibrionales bacterium]
MNSRLHGNDMALNFKASDSSGGLLKRSMGRLSAHSSMNKNRLLFAVITALLLLQFLGLNFGLPQQYHPDEYYINIKTFQLFNSLKNLAFEKDKYMLGIRWVYFASFVVVFGVGRVVGAFESFADYYAHYFAFGNPYVDGASPWFYLPPRCISFLFYVGCIVLVYFIAKKLAGRDEYRHFPWIVTLTAVLLPGGYLYSHYGTRESATCFFTLLMIYHAGWLFRPEKWSSVLAGGILLGLGTGIKENAGIFVVLYGFRMFWAMKKGVLRWPQLAVHGAIFTAATFGAFYLINPQRIALSNVNRVVALYRKSEDRRFTVEYSATHGVYPLAFMREFSLPGIVLLVIGAIVAWVKKPQTRQIALIVLGTYIALDFTKATGLKADRYIMNVFLPFLLVGATGLYAWLQKKRWTRWMWVLPTVVLLFNGRELASIFLNFNGHDTRRVAGAWIDKHVPRSSRIARETIYTPYLDPGEYDSVHVEWILGLHDLDTLRARKFDYLIISHQFHSGWAYGEHVKQNYAAFLPYAVKKFDTAWRPRLNNFHSPAIWVCKIQ